MINRERSFDISKLTPEEADQLSIALGNKVREIADEASNKANALLKVYGMCTKFQLVIEQIDSLGPEMVALAPQLTPKKRGRKPKQS